MIYKKLLAFNIKGIKEFGNLTINLVSEDQKTVYDKDNELIELIGNIYTNKLNYIYGKNASGKTNLLNLISTVNKISSLNNDKTEFSFYNIDKETQVTLSSLYSIGEELFKQSVKFNLEKISENEFEFKYTLDKSFVYVNKLTYQTYEEFQNLLKTNKGFVEIGENISVNSKEKSDVYEKIINDKFITKNLFSNNVINYILNGLDKYDSEVEIPSELKINKNDFNELKKNIETYLRLAFSDSSIFDISTLNLPDTFVGKNIINEMKDDALKFIKVFDKQIKKIAYDETWNGFKITFTNGKVAHEKSLSKILSTGTERGITTLFIIKILLKNGKDVFIDEIEANFNHKIVKFIIELFLDNEINKYGSRLFASTHYLETLNTTRRRDGIFISQRERNSQKIFKLNKLEDVEENKKRKDIKNSKLVNEIYSLDIEPGLEESVLFKNLFK